MTIHGIGTDIIEIDRFLHKGALLSKRFMERCFTENERGYLSGKGIESTAGLFAAKDAVVKAMGTGFCGFWPSAVEIKHNASGKPCVVLHGKAADAANEKGILHIEVSISHCRMLALATAVAMRGVTPA